MPLEGIFFDFMWLALALVAVLVTHILDTVLMWCLLHTISFIIVGRGAESYLVG